MSLVIIRHLENGEIQAVADPEGYDESSWEVLGIDREPLPNEVWRGEGWVIDETLQAKRDAEAEVSDKQRLRRALKIARARILQLEDRQGKLIEAVKNLKQRVEALEIN